MTTLDKALKLKKKANPFSTRFAVCDAKKASIPIRACPPNWALGGVRFRCKIFVAYLRIVVATKMGAGGRMDFLGFFQASVLFDEFLLAVPGKTDGQLDLVARAFPTQNQAPSVLCVAHV